MLFPQFKDQLQREFLIDLFNRSRDDYHEDFVLRSVSLAFDLNLPRRVLAVYIEPSHDPNSVLTEVGRICDPANPSYLPLGENHLFLLEQHIETTHSPVFEQLASYLCEQVPGKVFVGVSDYGLPANLAYQQSIKALKEARNHFNYYLSESPLCFYEQVRLGRFARDIKTDKKQDFVDTMLNGLDATEREQAITILRAYIKHNGSIEKTAQACFLHKNTLQYKLNMIKEKTGHDPRNRADIGLFYLALFLAPAIKPS